MGDWKEVLQGLQKELVAEERAEQEEKASVLAGFRKRLLELEPVVKAASEFGDAFGVECRWSISRYDQRYPSLQFSIKSPALAYEVTCRDGVIRERMADGEGKEQIQATTLEALSVERFEEQVTRWVQAAANANRKMPGRRR